MSAASVEGGGPQAAEGAAGGRPRASERVGPGRARVLLAALLAAQAALALCAHAGRVFLDDEVGTWRAARGSFADVLTTFDEWQTQPGYFLLAKLCAVPLGPTALALRLPALGFALLLTAATYGLVARLFDRTAGLLAATLVALHPFVLFYAQMARGYTMAMALAVLSLLCVHRLARGDARGWTGPLLVLARAGSVYAHLGAAATFVGELLLAWAATRTLAPTERRQRFLVAVGWSAAGGVVALALYAPLLPGMLEFRERWTGQNQGGFSFGFVPLVARVYGGGDPLGGIVLGALVVLGAATLARQADARGAGLALAAAVAAVVAFYRALDTAHYPWAFARFLTPALPLLLVFAAAGLRLVPGRGLLVALVFVVGLAYRDSARVAFGARDLHWPTMLEEIAAAGPRTLVLAPVRFHAVEPYLAELEGSGVRVVGIERVPELLARGGAGALAAQPLTVLQDVVPTDGLDAHFTRRVYGATTRLERAPAQDDPRALLAALRALAEAQVAFLEPREGTSIRGHWVFWRLDERHEHPWAATLSLGAAHTLRAVTAELLGDLAAAERSHARALELRDAVPPPGAVRSAW